MPQHQQPKDKTCPPRPGTEMQNAVSSGRIKKSKSQEGSTIIPAPSASPISGVTEWDGASAVLVPALS